MKMKKQTSSSTTASSGAYSSYSASASSGYTSPPTSVAGSQRWSDVIPPKTALTFAVVWDPDSEMVAFSGAQFLDAVDATSTSPSDAYSVARSSTLRWFQDNHEYLFGDDEPVTHRLVAGRTQTSSTLLRSGVLLPRPESGSPTRHPNRYFSCMDDLDKTVSFDPQTDFAKKWIEFLKNEAEVVHEDEGFFDVATKRSTRRTSLRTTTFTASFVAVEVDDALSSWSAVPPPSANYEEPASTLGRRLKRLRKTRPVEKPVHPLVVLGREEYNHTPPTRPSVPLASRLPLPNFLSRWKDEKGKHYSWICVDIAQDVGI